MKGPDILSEAIGSTDRLHFLDLFCGGGGSGNGIIQAFELQGKQAHGTFINHWDHAINIHSVNHPNHRHLCTGVDDVTPAGLYDDSQKLNLLWGSPECTHHSVARGGKPMNEQSRATAQCLIRWIRHKRPEHVLVENVKEFMDWGPLRQKRNAEGQDLWVFTAPSLTKKKPKKTETTSIPFKQEKGESRPEWLKRLSAAGYEMSLVADKRRKGERFRQWVRDIRKMGYEVEWKVLCSADYGDPTSRRRLFVNCARIDSGKKVVWPNPTHAKPDKLGMVPIGRQPWKTARDHVVDWSNLGQSIFTRKRPLSEKTLRRIAIGLEKYGLAGFQFPQQAGGRPVKGMNEPVSPVTTTGAEGVVFPNVTHMEPCLVQQQGASTAQSVDEPLNAVLGGPKHYLLNPALVKLKGTGTAGNVDLPLDTVAAGGFHHALMHAFLVATDQTGGRPDGSYSADEPVKTMVTKANQAVCSVKLNPAVIQTAHGVDHNDEARRVKSGDEPLGAIHAGGGSYGVMQAEIGIVPQFGEREGQEPRVHSVGEPLPAVTSHGAGAVVTGKLEPFIVGTAHAGGDDSRVRGILEPLSTACGNRGDQAICRPWLYTFYSSGSEGALIDGPVPTARTHDSIGVCYPVVEFDGQFYILDIYFRMLGVRELARAQGFPDDYEFPGTKTKAVKAIGNAVSCAIARALVLAATSQNPNIIHFLEQEVEEQAA